MSDSRVERRLRYLRTGTNSNFTITCCGREWKVHKDILSVETDFFEVMCFGNFEETINGKVDFPEQKPEVIDQVLVYLYTGVYDDLVVLKQDEDENDTGSKDDGATSPIPHELDHTYRVPAEFGYGMGHYPAWSCAPRKRLMLMDMDNADAAMVTRIFTTAILTYCCAEMMGLGDLQTRVVARLMDKERYLSHSYLGRVLETLFTNTKPEDRPMRISLLFRCLENHEMISGHFPSAIATLEKYEKVSWEVGLLYEKKMECKHREYVSRGEDFWGPKAGVYQQTKEENETLARQIANHEKEFADLTREFYSLRRVCKCGQEDREWRLQVRAPGSFFLLCECGYEHLYL